MAYEKFVKPMIVVVVVSYQIDKLVKAGADLLAPIHVFDKGPPGTVVDYAHYVFNQVISLLILVN